MGSGTFAQDVFSSLTFLVTGGSGFLGRYVCGELRRAGVADARIVVPERASCDLTREQAVDDLLAEVRPDVVLHLAAEDAGVGAGGGDPGRLFFANMAMGLHLMEASRRHEVEKFVQVGTVRSYPKFTPVPFQESDFWNGCPEDEDAAYGVAKRALQVMGDAYRTQYGFNAIHLVPTGLYGPQDDFDQPTAHVIAALIRKVVEAMENHQDTILCWGDGSPTRDFLYIEDAARGIVDAARTCNEPGPINLGSGRETSIRELAEQIGRICGYEGRFVWDTARPNGQLRRCLDTTLAANCFGFHTAIGLEQGLRATIDWYRRHRSAALAASV